MQIDWSKIFSYINRETDENTREEVERWLKADIRNKLFYRRILHYYADNPTHNESFSEEKLDRLYSKLQKAASYKRRRILWQRAAVAASVVLLIALSIWQFYDIRNEAAEHPSTAMKKMNTGAPVTVITESMNKYTVEELNLKMAQKADENKLNYTAFEHIRHRDSDHSEEKIPTHTVVVPRGRIFELVLSDGTVVLLSPASELTYPAKFDSDSIREVKLRGEAYFEVAKSSNRFRVNTEHMKLQVYGTTFNVISRENRPDEAVLLEGVVGITPQKSSGEKETVLRPGDKSSVDKSGKISISHTDSAEYIAKRNGYILFNGKTIKQVIADLELYYDVDFIFEDVSSLEKEEYVFSVKQDASLREALNILGFVSGIQFIIEGKEVKIVE